MSQVEESIEVNVPVRTAYNQWTQFEDFPQFMDGVERIEQRTDTLTHWKTKIGGVEREFDAEITEQIPDERVAWTTTGGEAKQAGVVTFHRIDDSTTKVMLQLDYEPDGLAETVGDKLGFVKRQAAGDLKRSRSSSSPAAAGKPAHGAVKSDPLGAHARRCSGRPASEKPVGRCSRPRGAVMSRSGRDRLGAAYQ